MDFQFSDEQKQLGELLGRFIAKEYSFETRRKLVAAPPGRVVWRKLAEIGVLGITLPEAHGGFGGGAVDALVILEAFGRGLVAEPYLPTVILGGGLVRDLGTPAQLAELIPGIVAGDIQLALAHDERDGRYECSHVATRARPEGDGHYRLDGDKAVVLGGDGADLFIVSARSSGGVDEHDGVSLFLVKANAPGLSRRGQAGHDGAGVASLRLDGVIVGSAARLGPAGGASAALERALDFAIAGLCAEAVGCMSALNQQTLEYLKTRKQFGVPIGKFQALQHRMVDMFLHTEQARSMAYLAAVKVHSSDDGERRRALSAAKALVGQAARFVGQSAVQLHGGMGVTDELPAAHYFKRLTTINLTCGDADHHLGRFSDALL